jgi:hypothetical protein
MSDKVGRILKEATMASSRYFQHLHGGTEENLGEISTTVGSVLTEIRTEHVPALVSLH